MTLHDRGASGSSQHGAHCSRGQAKDQGLKSAVGVAQGWMRKGNQLSSHGEASETGRQMSTHYLQTD